MRKLSIVDFIIPNSPYSETVKILANTMEAKENNPRDINDPKVIQKVPKTNFFRKSDLDNLDFMEATNILFLFFLNSTS
jgi:hypothetical protein